jgi:hypothetical protein
MGLIDLKTNLKSLKYGNDQKGGGSSNQPYIVTPIPDGFADTSPDFLLRNGYLNPLSSTQDVSRLTKMFLDTKSPNGLLFITKQELLERQNVEIPGGFNRIYNPLGTLAQAGVVSTGYHLNKQGFNPFQRGYFNGGRNGYYQTTLDDEREIQDGYAINRLYALYKIKQTADGEYGNEEFKKRYEISSDPNISLSYNGGPGSFLGFGKTNIRIQNPTRIVVPKEEATKTYRSLFVDNVDYLIPSGPFTINWNYRPTDTGVTDKYFLKTGVVTEGLFTNNDLLNRNTSTVIPIGKPANTFNKNTGKLKSDPGYLAPSNINTRIAGLGRLKGVTLGNIRWVYNPSYNLNINGQPGVSVKYTAELNLNEEKVYETFYTSNPSNLLNRTGLEGKDAPKSIYPSSSIINKQTYGEVRAWSNIFLGAAPSLITASATYNKKSFTQIDNSILSLINNFDQNIPEIYEVPKNIVEGKQKNTALSSLNPQYFIYDQKKNEITGSNNAYPNIQTFNRETTYNTSKTTYLSNTDVSNTQYSDGQNKRNILQGSRNNQNEQANSDLIKFFFEINNNNALTDTQNWFLFFRAYLNDFGDSYKADWQSYKYIGRAENFYKYGGFSRDISLGFTIYAHTRAEMAPIYNKLNYLVGTTAPDYSDAGYMRGNFVNLTIGDYLDNVPGIINDISLKPSFDAGWDINRNVTTGKIQQQSHLQLPKLIEVSMTFTPIHSFTPRFGEAFIRNEATGQPPKPTTNIQQPTQDGIAG